MTATPIPRTLHLEPDRCARYQHYRYGASRKVAGETYVGEMDEARLHRAILRELDRGGQVFIVHNRVQSIDIVRKQIQRLVPEAQVVVGTARWANAAGEE